MSWKCTKVHPQERNTWRSGVRSAMHMASQLPDITGLDKQNKKIMGAQWLSCRVLDLRPRGWRHCTVMYCTVLEQDTIVPA